MSVRETADITIAQWFKRFGSELITADGRGAGILKRLTENVFSITLTDKQLSEPPPKLDESQEAYACRMESEASCAILGGGDDVIVGVAWFLDEVSFSKADQESILQHWKKKAGLD